MAYNPYTYNNPYLYQQLQQPYQMSGQQQHRQQQRSLYLVKRALEVEVFLLLPRQMNMEMLQVGLPLMFQKVAVLQFPWNM